MYELMLYDEYQRYIGTFRVPTQKEADFYFADFAEGRQNVELFSPEGKMLRKWVYMN